MTVTDVSSLVLSMIPLIKKERCNVNNCTRFLKPSDMPCRCKKRFCMLHKHAELHMCSYDFKMGSAMTLDEAKQKIEVEIERMRCDISKHNIERI